MNIVIRAAACWFFIFHAMPALADEPLPVEKDPYHKLISEKPYTRVFVQVESPGKSTTMHTHPRDFLLIGLGSTQIEIHTLTKPMRMEDTKQGTIRLVKGPITHMTRNVGKTDHHLVLFEIEDVPAGWQKMELPPLSDTMADADDDRIRAWKTTLKPGERVKTEWKSPGYRVAWGNLKISVENGSGPKKIRSLAKGELEELGPGTQTLTCLGVDPCEFENIVFKLKKE